jgi:hypothetical protein
MDDSKIRNIFGMCHSTEYSTSVCVLHTSVNAVLNSIRIHLDVFGFGEVDIVGEGGLESGK